MPSTIRPVALLGACILSAGCGGGMPLFHPAHALPPDRVTMGAGVSAQFVSGQADDQIQAARQAMADGAVTPNETNAYIAGDHFTIADIGFMPYIEYLYAAKQGDLIDGSPAVHAWWKKISARPSWKAAIGG